MEIADRLPWSALLLVCSLGVQACNRNACTCSADEPESKSSDIGQCGTCGKPIHVTLIFRNEIQDPKFNEIIPMKNVNQRELIFLLLNLDDVRYTMSYHGKQFGMMIDSVNGVKGDWDSNKTYWKLVFGNGTDLKFGVSTYMPQNDDTIIFLFTRFASG